MTLRSSVNDADVARWGASDPVGREYVGTAASGSCAVPGRVRLVNMGLGRPVCFSRLAIKASMRAFRVATTSGSLAARLFSSNGSWIRL